MRYQNWDILLFPAASRVPIQEFDVKFHVLPYPPAYRNMIQSKFSNMEATRDAFESMTHLPMLTSFIPSIEPDSFFRISIHNWGSPRPSRILSKMKSSREAVMFEARIYIDGLLVAQRLFDSSSTWPKIIECCGSDETMNHAKLLRFPHFHEEVLDHEHWDAGDTQGRIRVVISEGVSQSSQLRECVPDFNRLRDAIAFSFQHAPQDVLEYSGIAWPHIHRFRKEIDRNLRSCVSANRSGSPIPVTSKFHTQSFDHSKLVNRYTSPADIPERRREICEDGYMPAGYHGVHQATSDKDAGRAKTESWYGEDPFFDAKLRTLRQKYGHSRSDSDGRVAQDCRLTQSRHVHNGTEMSGVMFQPVDFQRTMDEVAVDEIIRALSPVKRVELFEALSPVKSAIRGSQGATSVTQSVQSMTPTPQSYTRGFSLLNRLVKSPATTSQLGVHTPTRSAQRSVTHNSPMRLESKSVNGGNSLLSSRWAD